MQRRILTAVGVVDGWAIDSSKVAAASPGGGGLRENVPAGKLAVMLDKFEHGERRDGPPICLAIGANLETSPFAVGWVDADGARELIAALQAALRAIDAPVDN